MYPTLDHKGRNYWAFGVWTGGRIELAFCFLQTRPPFDTATKRLDLLHRLTQVPDLNLNPDAITRRPNIPLAALHPPGALDAFLAALDWFNAEVRTT
jgi:hypothetical protein